MHCVLDVPGLLPDGFVFELTQLERFGTEASLQLAIDAVLMSEDINEGAGKEAAEGASQYSAQSESPTRILLIQCDPARLPAGLLSHAMHICQQRHTLAPQLSVLRHIVLLLHLPPGTSKLKRKVSLDFNPRWRMFYVDDLRGEESESGMAGTTAAFPSLLTMLDTSIAEMVESGAIPLERMLDSAGLRRALVIAVPPPEAGAAGKLTLGGRIAMVQWLCAEEPRFVALLRRAILAVLEFHAMRDAHGRQLQARAGRLAAVWAGPCVNRSSQLCRRHWGRPLQRSSTLSTTTWGFSSCTTHSIHTTARAVR